MSDEQRKRKGPPSVPDVSAPDLESMLEDVKPLPVHSEPPKKNETEEESR